MIHGMWNDTPFRRLLGLRYPIVQGPFGGGFSSARLTAIISNAGGLGSFGAQGQPPARMGEIVGDIRQLTAAPFAVNLWVSTEDDAARTLTGRTRQLQPLAPLFEELSVATGVRFATARSAIRWRDPVARCVSAIRRFDLLALVGQAAPLVRHHRAQSCPDDPVAGTQAISTGGSRGRRRRTATRLSKPNGIHQMKSFVGTRPGRGRPCASCDQDHAGRASSREPTAAMSQPRSGTRATSKYRMP